MYTRCQAKTMLKMSAIKLEESYAGAATVIWLSAIHPKYGGGPISKIIYSFLTLKPGHVVFKWTKGSRTALQEPEPMHLMLKRYVYSSRKTSHILQSRCVNPPPPPLMWLRVLRHFLLALRETFATLRDREAWTSSYTIFAHLHKVRGTTVFIQASSWMSGRCERHPLT